MVSFSAPDASIDVSNDCTDVLTETKDNDGNSISLQGLVVGPESNQIAVAKRFRAVWAGGKLCLFLKVFVVFFTISE